MGKATANEAVADLLNLKESMKKIKKIETAKAPKGKVKIEKVMGEFKEGKLHSGSKKGPEVVNPKQAVAIAMSKAKLSKKKKKK